jgi:hypothetical protein
MNRQPFERDLRTFVSDVPEVAPRDLLESLLIELPTVSQRRRRFGVGRRFPKMSMPLRALATVAAVLVVALAAYTFLPKSSGVGSNPSPGPAASPTASPSPVASPEPTPTPRIAGAITVSDGATLDSGVRYVAPDFEPMFTFTGSPKLIYGLDGARHAFFGATTPSTDLGVVDAGSAFDESGKTIEVPSDVTAWIHARTDLDVLSTTPVELGTTSATLIEAKVHADAHTNAAGAINLFCPGAVDKCDFEEGGSIGYIPGNHVLVMVAPVAGKAVVAMATAPETSWTIVGGDAEAFLRSFQFPS